LIQISRFVFLALSAVFLSLLDIVETDQAADLVGSQDRIAHTIGWYPLPLLLSDKDPLVRAAALPHARRLLAFDLGGRTAAHRVEELSSVE